MTPDSGNAPLEVETVCEGFQVNTWQIDCGNGEVFNGTGNNSGDETFTRTCTYTTPGNYNPRCTINGNITNSSCRKTVQVADSLNPRINVDKRDMNPLDLDGNI